jgi:hypothetical protein
MKETSSAIAIIALVLSGINFFWAFLWTIRIWIIGKRPRLKISPYTDGANLYVRIRYVRGEVGVTITKPALVKYKTNGYESLIGIGDEFYKVSPDNPEIKMPLGVNPFPTDTILDIGIQDFAGRLYYQQPNLWQKFKDKLHWKRFKYGSFGEILYK